MTAKRRRYAIIDNRKKDEWSGFADLLANLIEKYAAVLDIDNLPEPPSCLEEENTSEEPSDTIELTGKQQYNSRGISVQTLCESYCSQRIELHRIKAQYPVAQLEMRCSGEQL